MTLDEQIRVMREAKAGWAIQLRTKGGDNWLDTAEPVWNFKDFEYRKKPFYQYRPYTPEEANNKTGQTLIKATRPTVDRLLRFITFEGRACLTGIGNDYIQEIIGLSTLLRDYLFRTATEPPCGMPMSKDELMEFTAKAMLKENPEATLTGSFMLQQHGISLGRSAQDLDFIAPDVKIKFPSEFEVTERSINTSYPCQQFIVNGFKVDILLANGSETIDTVNGYKCASIEDLIKAKQSYGNAEKHRRDLDILFGLLPRVS